MRSGFTLIELVIALAILSVLVVMAAPVMKLQAQRQKEAELRLALRDIRGALDAYKRATDEQRVPKASDASGFPRSLESLTRGITDAKDPNGHLIYFLRRVPRDPMNPDLSLDPAATWVKRSYASPPDAPAEGEDVFDVYSKSADVGINGVPYRDW
jgi:general secretion pathway protein G